MNILRITQSGPAEYSLGQLRADNPQVSFPAQPSLETLAEYGVFPFTVPDMPALQPGQQAVPGEFTETPQGWVRGWQIITPPPTAEAVNAERDRRLRADFAFQGVMFQRDPTSIARITGAATLAGFAIGNGAQPGDLTWHGGDQPFVWIASDNQLVPMDAPTAFAFGAECAAVETRIVFAARVLRDSDPIPADFADDKWWP